MRLARSHAAGDHGFTLIELMVVVLIIAVLLAIAIPTFLGARTRASNRAAQSALRNSLTAAKSIYSDKQTFTAADATGLQAEEPSIAFDPPGTASTGPNQVSVSAADSEWYAAAHSKTGTCFYISDTTGTGGTRYFSSTSDPCTGDAATANSSSFTGTSWSN